MDSWQEIINDEGSNSLRTYFRPDNEFPNILMQFTGITDKNGKDIYQGDIDKSGLQVGIGGYIETSTWDGTTGFGVHLFNKDDSVVKAVGPWEINKELEIIGNIYENPELIKK